MNRMTTLLLALGLALSACAQGPGETENDAAQVPAATATDASAPSTATAGETNEIVYVDVRTPEEYAAGHVEGAINIPHTEMQARHEELEPYADRQIVVYCRSGRRSSIAKGILEQEGFTGVVNGGGLSDLAQQGVPTTR